MKLKQMEYFICLCEERSFSAAAVQLGISQPTLTQAIQKLESTVGSPLIDRSVSPFILTEAGRIFLNTCKEVTESTRRGFSQITELRQGVRGTIRLGVAPYRARAMLPDCLAEFRRLYPDVRVQIRELVTDSLLEEMKNGELDLAITIKQDDLDPGFKCVPIAEESVLIAVPECIAKNNGALRAAKNGGGPPTVEPRAFEGMDFILLGEGQLLSRYFEAFLSGSGMDSKKMIRCTEIETAIALANAGCGAALMLSTGLGYYKKRYPELRYYYADTPMPKRTIYVLSRKKQSLTEAEKDFIGLLSKAANGKER